MSISESNNTSRPGDTDLPQLIVACRQGDETAAENICDLLSNPLRLAVQRFLPADGDDQDDVLQETLIAVINYLRTNSEFSGNLVKFAVTIACNRCRDVLRYRQRKRQEPIESLTNWIADRSRSPLDHLQEQEILAHLRAALEQLDPNCRSLLRDMYIKEIPPENLRQQMGLKSVHGVYYRRSVCLKKALRILRDVLSDRSLKGDDLL
ncbi:MAG: sigma-70 family RNA polymerase sigma factor [bacterium]